MDIFLQCSIEKSIRVENAAIFGRGTGGIARFGGATVIVRLQHAGSDYRPAARCQSEMLGVKENCAFFTQVADIGCQPGKSSRTAVPVSLAPINWVR
jgi:hypothetical protein